MWQDVRFSVRTLANSPGFAVAAIIALALGIGANATVFSLANAILFKNLPFTDSARVAFVSTVEARGTHSMSYADYEDLRPQLRSFSGLGALARERVNLSDDANLPDTCDAPHVTANSFAVLGQHPAMGRFFVPDDERTGAEPVAVLSYALWEKRYGRDAAILGKRIRVNSTPTTVVGVAAPGFEFPPETGLWQPYVPNLKAKRDSRNLVVFGRLADGASLSAAQAEVAVAAKNLAIQYPETNKNTRFRVQNFNELALGGPIRTVVLALLGAVGFVLLIACANVANLLLGRAVGRAREISIRAALGAGRWRVVRQLLIESILLAGAGGVIGWAVAIWGIRAFDAAVIPTGKPPWIDFAMDYRVFAYLAVITIGTAALFGLVPALRLSRMDVNAALKEGGRTGQGIRGKRISGALVVVEMTLAVVLLAGAGLMMRSFLAAYLRPAGVNTANVLTMWVELPEAKYGKPAERIEFERRLTERLRAVPGVEEAAVASSLLGQGNMSFPYEIEGRPDDPEHRPSTRFLAVGNGYFETLHLSARRGRALNAGDHLTGPQTAVINETMARQLWPKEDPVGKRFRIYREGKAGEWTTVVGIVPDYLPNVQKAEPEAAAILPFRQEPQSWLAILARTRVEAGSLGNAFRAAVQTIDPDLPVRRVQTLDEQLALSRWPWRIFGSMFAIFAGIALLLATVGLYAVVANGVSQRTQEIGVRVALGASPADILRLVFGSGLGQAALGLALGLLAAAGVTRVLATLLVGVSPTDLVTFGTAAALLMASAVLGCLIPARRAMRVDPTVALRSE